MCVVVKDAHMYLIGGANSHQVFKEIWVTSDGDTWGELEVGDDFPEFYGHGCVSHKNSIIVAGNKVWGSCPKTGYTVQHELCHTDIANCMT